MAEPDAMLNPLLSGHGIVPVAGLQVYITPLSAEEELLLVRELRRRAQEYYGSPYQRVRGMLAELPEADRLVVLQELARAAIRKEPLSVDALDDYALSDPDWIAYELWLRGRKATPGLTLEGLSAVINPANALEVASALRQAVLLSTREGHKSASA